MFNALVCGAKADAQNYPFCTIEPNVGVVEVPDERLKPLSDVSKSKKIVPTVIEFVDIAGLVRGANKGEGLGNQFLAHIRECDAIAMVVRLFEDPNIVHVEGKIDPSEDIKTIETELQLADISTVEKRLYSVEKELKTGSKEALSLHHALQKIKDALYAGKNVRSIMSDLSADELKSIKGLSLLTMKPVLYIANVSEGQLKDWESLKANSYKLEANMIPISAKVESELNELAEAEKKEYLEALGMEDSGLNKLIKEAYKTLGLITYFTSGEPETRAWTIKEGTLAPQAAGVIHTDFEHGFIAAEVIPWQDLVANGGWSASRAKGLVRTEGKNYVFKDGDTTLFRFNV